MINNIKEEIIRKFYGEISDWEFIDEKDEDIFKVRRFKSKNTGETITSVIGWKDNGDSRRWFFKEEKYEFSLYSVEHNINRILYKNIEDLEENAYVIYFCSEKDPYPFEWSVGNYLSLFQNLSDDYLETGENNFVYCGTECTDLDEVIGDLEKMGFVYKR